MDTSETEFAPLLKDSTEEKVVKDSFMPQKALYSIKPIPSELPLPSSESAASSALPSPTPSNEMATPSNEILSSLATSTNSSDSMSPVLQSIDPANQNESKASRDARRGSKVKRVM